MQRRQTCINLLVPLILNAQFFFLVLLLEGQLDLPSLVVLLLHEVAGTSNVLFIFDWRTASTSFGFLLFFRVMVVLHLVAMDSFLAIVIKVGVMGRDMRLSIEFSCRFVVIRLPFSAFELTVEFASIR